MFHSFFISLARSWYLSFFSLSFKFIILWSARTAKSTILHILIFLLIIMRCGLLAGIKWSVCMLKSHRSLCESFSRTDAGLCIYHLFVWSNWILLSLLLLFYSFESFSHHRQLMLFYWSLSDTKSPQVSRTFLSIRADLNNTAVLMVATSPFISKSSLPTLLWLYWAFHLQVVSQLLSCFIVFQFSSKFLFYGHLNHQNPVNDIFFSFY